MLYESIALPLSYVGALSRLVGILLRVFVICKLLRANIIEELPSNLISYVFLRNLQDNVL